MTEGDVETYERDGVVCLRGVFARHWIDVLGEGVEKDIRAPGPLHTLQQTMAQLEMTARIFDLEGESAHPVAGGAKPALLPYWAELLLIMQLSNVTVAA